MSGIKNKTDAELAEIQRKLDERAAARAAKEAEKKAWWTRYYEQLAKSTPNQGGSSHKNRRKIFNVHKLM